MAVFSTKRINTQAQALLAELEEFCGVHFDARAVAALEIAEKHLAEAEFRGMEAIVPGYTREEAGLTGPPIILDNIQLPEGDDAA